MNNKIEDVSFDKLFNQEKKTNKEHISEKEEIIETMKVYNNSEDIDNIDLNKEERLATNIAKEVAIPDIRKMDSIQRQIKEWHDTGEDIIIADKIFHLAATGALRKDIKKTLKINVRLWNEMLRDPNSIYSMAIREGEPLGADNVIDALQSIAIGYDYFEYKKGTRNGKDFHEVHKRHLPPNLNAITKYLSTKLPEIWGTNNELNINVNKNETLSVEKLKNADIKLLKRLMLLADGNEKEGEIIDVQ